MRITEEQMALIRSLHCERLASNEENLRLIDSFYSTRNNNIAEALLNEAYQEDESGVIAYYVVKGQILTRIFQIRLGYEDTNDWLMI
jgi:hypothetical protein